MQTILHIIATAVPLSLIYFVLVVVEDMAKRKPEE